MHRYHFLPIPIPVSGIGIKIPVSVHSYSVSVKSKKEKIPLFTDTWYRYLFTDTGISIGKKWYWCIPNPDALHQQQQPGPPIPQLPVLRWQEWPDVVFCCCSSSFSRLDVCSVQRRSSAYFGCNGWIFQLLSDLPVSSKQLALWPLTRSAWTLLFQWSVLIMSSVCVCFRWVFPLWLLSGSVCPYMVRTLKASFF